MDMNNDGFVSREDFELMAKRLVGNSGKISKEKTDDIFKAFLAIPDYLGVKPGEKLSLEEAAKLANEKYLSPNAQKPSGYHDTLFDCIDTDSDGVISMEEFKVYFKIVGHDITDEEIKHAFHTIDANGNGKISRDEFVAAAKDFYFGVEETELSKAFCGKLLPQ